MAPAPMRPKARVLQWVVTGISEMAPQLRQTKKGNQPTAGYTLQEQRKLRRLRGEARRAGKDPSRVLLPPKRMPERPRLASVSLDLLPPPSTMDAAALGRAANIAAREPAGGDPALWSQLGDRAREILPMLDPQDLALFLNGMARVRITDERLVGDLRMCVLRRAGYFNARHFAMAFGALARLGLPMEDCEKLVVELDGRLPEFQTAGELAMVAAALGRLRICDQSLLAKLVSQVDARLSAGKFYAWDLATVSAAYVRVRYLDPTHMEHIARCSMGHLRSASPRELARLVLAVAMSAPGREQLASGESTEVQLNAAIGPMHALAAAAMPLASDKLRFMLPAELVDVAFAFGNALGAGLCSRPEASSLMRGIAREASISAARMKDWEFASLLRSFARWRVPVMGEDLGRLAEHASRRSGELPIAIAGDTFSALARMISTARQAPQCSSSSSSSSSSPSRIGAASSPTLISDAGVSDSTRAAVAELECVVLRALERSDEAFVEEESISRAVEAAYLLAASDCTKLKTSLSSAEQPHDKLERPLSLEVALASRLAKEPLLGVAWLELLKGRLLELGAAADSPLLKVMEDHCRSRSFAPE